MGKKSDILTSDNQHLALMFNSGGIKVNKELPKYFISSLIILNIPEIVFNSDK